MHPWPSLQLPNDNFNHSRLFFPLPYSVQCNIICLAVQVLGRPARSLVSPLLFSFTSSLVGLIQRSPAL